MKAEESVQKGLFETNDSVSPEDVLLFALGDFQSRGFELIGRKIALDRLLGAVSRACVEFNIDTLSDASIVDSLRNLGATVEELPSFVAKHPFRVTVTTELAETAVERFKTRQKA